MSSGMSSSQHVPQYGRFEQQFTSRANYANPLQDTALHVTFTSPSGKVHSVDGFWDGGSDWRVRFSPDERGKWHYSTECSDASNSSLHGQSGSFSCGESTGSTPFSKHGHIHLSENRRYLAHTDGTPFFWLADTAWNGPLRSTDDEWAHYLRERVRQKFTAVQWVTTQWVAAPDGDINGDLAYTGTECIELNPAFFRRLDGKIDAINDAGLLAVPVLLWVAGWSTEEGNRPNPGWSLPEDQAILLARYMVARWGAHSVVWILNGDGDYRSEAAAQRWRAIGRGVFGGREHAPVSLHPQGIHWNLDDFAHEDWLDIVGYQGGHYTREEALTWLLQGPPSQDWQKAPTRPVINLEPPYEGITSIDTGILLNDVPVRQALYWSLLLSPTAGVTYGGHGVWGWDDGTAPSVNHEVCGVPLAWQHALTMPMAEQLTHLRSLFDSVEWWRLCPAPNLIAASGETLPREQFVVAACSEAADLAIVYIPAEGQVSLNLEGMQPDLRAVWMNPRTGQRHNAAANSINGSQLSFVTPEPGDWVLILNSGGTQ
jgi:hypothetical protein